jgi:uncharacterized membrane protein YjfL (UPF0719 family)
MQYIVWIMGAVAAFRLWDNVRWLSIVAVVLAVSYGVHRHETAEYEHKGEHSDSTATRLAITATLLVGILIYSFFA